MKSLQRVFIGIVIVILLIPVVLFNFTPNFASSSDNRMLAENPFTTEGEFTTNMENYINDRIGLRNEMILSYIVLNDIIFQKMEHPSYNYGEDGYLFGAGVTVNSEFTEYHKVFASMVKNIQNFCQARNIPFLFVFNPAKPAIYTEYVQKGIAYDRVWTEGFFKELDALGVRYVDNTTVLREKRAEGEVVFNKRLDANHWNILGAYYGTNAVLTELNKDFGTINIAGKEDIVVSQIYDTLPLTYNFNIKEWVPFIAINGFNYNSIASKYSGEIEVNNSFRYFDYTTNTNAVNAPKALVFQGSYMNIYGRGFFENAFSEYISVHDYQNVLNFEYYYNIFKPECMVFEVAEYTLESYYFHFENMQKMKITPEFNSLTTEQKGSLKTVNNYGVEKGEMLTKIKINYLEESEFAWLDMNEIFEMKKSEDGYEVTVLTEKFEANKNSIKIYAL